MEGREVTQWGRWEAWLKWAADVRRVDNRLYLKKMLHRICSFFKTGILEA